MTGPGGTDYVSQACAACKHQRRKCAPDCALAPYFPPHRQTDFLNVHKLFGIRNIINTVRTVDPNQREIAVRSMIEEAKLREMDPVGGSCGMVKNLHDKCDLIKIELDMVLQQLDICRAAAQREGENGENRSNVRSFYDDLMPRTPGTVPLNHRFVDKGSNVSPPHHNDIETSKKASTSGKDDDGALQIVLYEKNGAKKMRNIDINKEFPAEMEENDLDKPVPEDVKQNTQD